MMNRRELLKALVLTTTVSQAWEVNAAPPPPANSPAAALSVINAKKLDDKISQAMHEGYLAFLDANQFEAIEPDLLEGMGVYLTTVMKGFEDSGVIFEFMVVCDASNNPPSVQSTNLIAVDAFWKHTRGPNMLTLYLGPQKPGTTLLRPA